MTVVVCAISSNCFAERVSVLPKFHVEFGAVIEGEIIETTIEGVFIEPEGGPRVLLPWFAVDAHSDGWKVPSRFHEIAHASRIGYARIRRGDISGGADLYLSLSDGLVGSNSRMGREVFGGLLEDSILRGNLYDAAIAYQALVLSGGGQLEAVDDRYGVHVSLPLIAGLSESVGLNHLAERLDAHESLMLSRFERVAEEGFEDDAESVRFHSSREPTGGMSILGEELTLNMYIAQKHPLPEARSDARRWLQSRAESKSSSWVDLWCRLAIGSSYIRESMVNDDDSMCSIGVIHLLHVVVRFESTHPLLVRLAKGLALEALLDRGRVEEAAELTGAAGQ
jgi:hypothetical protein